MGREHPRVPMYRCRSITPRPGRGGLRGHAPGNELVQAAPFLAWLDERLEMFRRRENEHPSIRVGRGSNATGTGTPILGGERPAIRLMLSLGWEAESGLRRWSHWRNGGFSDGWQFSGWIPRDTIETALLHAGLRFEDVYPVGWDAPGLAWLQRVLVLHAIAEALERAQTDAWAAETLRRRPPKASFSLLAESIDAPWSVAS